MVLADISDEVHNDPIEIAEPISHEVGHTLGLLHDGEIGGSDYLLGHDPWSPIMGAGHGALTQWSKGEYAGANNKEDDVAVMAATRGRRFPVTGYVVRLGTEVSRTTRTSATRPGAARIGTAASGARGGAVTASARWSAPLSTGGSAIRSYQVRASRLSSTGATLSTRTFTAGKDVRRLVMRLTSGRYRFDVRAVNAIGAGAWSARSNKVGAR